MPNFQCDELLTILHPFRNDSLHINLYRNTEAYSISKPKKVKQLLIILADSLMKVSFFNMYGSVNNMYLPITSPCSHPQKYVRNITSVFIFNQLPVIYLSDAYDFSRFVPKYLSEPA